VSYSELENNGDQRKHAQLMGNWSIDIFIYITDPLMNSIARKVNLAVTVRSIQSRILEISD